MNILWLNVELEGKRSVSVTGIIDSRVTQPLAVAHAKLTYEGYDAAFLESVFVHPDYRKRGFARKLIEACKARAKKAGCVTLTLRVNDENIVARKVYRKLGFVPVYHAIDERTFFTVML